MDQYISNLNWFDIAMISIVFISTIFALFRGFIKALLSLIAWASSCTSAVALYPLILPLLSTKIHSEKLAIASSLGIIFLVVFIIIAIINSKIIYVLRRVTGGFIDRTLGLAFGAARGVLIVCLIFFTVSMTSKMLLGGSSKAERPGPDWFAKAGTYDIIDQATKQILAYAPEDLPKELESTIDKLKDKAVASMGDELKDSTGSSKTFTAEQGKTMTKIISALPPEDVAEIYKRNDVNISTMSDAEKAAFFKDIIAKYKSYESSGKVAADKKISDAEVKELEDTINNSKINANSDSSDSKGDVGYKDKNIKQLDRLIDGVSGQK